MQVRKRNPQKRFRLVRYYSQILKGIVKFQRLVLPDSWPPIHAGFHLQQAIIDDWRTVFPGYDIEGTPLPYHTLIGMRHMYNIVGRFGFNLKNAMHLKSELQFHRPVGDNYRHGKTYTGEFLMDEIFPLTSKTAGIRCSADIFEAGGDKLLTWSDFTVVKNVSPEDIAVLTEATRPGAAEAYDLIGLKGRRPSIERPVYASRLFLPLDMGRRYGEVSGDMNFVHINDRMSKLFGYRGAFLQGMGLTSLVLCEMKKFHVTLHCPHFSITFSNPAYLESGYELRYDGSRFELICDDGTLTCFGRFENVA